MLAFSTISIVKEEPTSFEIEVCSKYIPFKILFRFLLDKLN